MIQDVLEQLGIESNNQGTSTGSNWFGSGEKISSFTPVDGKHIAHVKTTTREDYDKVVETAEKAFKDKPVTFAGIAPDKKFDQYLQQIAF